MLDIIHKEVQNSTYGPKTQRVMEDTPIVGSEFVNSPDQEEQEEFSISGLATQMLDKIYAWRREENE